MGTCLGLSGTRSRLGLRSANTFVLVYKHGNAFWGLRFKIYQLRFKIYHVEA